MDFSKVFLLGCMGMQAVSAASVTVSTTVPSGASAPVNPQFLGMGIEAVSFPQYTGSKSSPNTFSLNMFASLTSRLTSLPIRLGGTSLDFSHWDPSQTQTVTYQNPNATGLTAKKTFGQPWLEGLSMIPGAKWVLMVPLAFQDLSNSVLFAKDTYNAMSSGSYHAFEIGNEVDSYATQDRVRDNSTWDEGQYVSQWVEWTDAIQGNISLPAKPNFWAMSLAITAPNSKWNVEGAFTSTPSLGSYTQRLQAVSQHFYQTTSKGTLGDSLLDPNKTTSAISEKSKNALAYLASRPAPTIPFVFGEVGDALLGGMFNHTLQSSLGSAVWNVDFMLASMVAGVQRVNLQNIDAAGFSAWWPVPVNHPEDGVMGGPTVWAVWYAMVLVADLIADAKTSLRVVPLGVTGSGQDGRLVAYAAYNGQNLIKVILLNEDLWVTADKNPRPVASITIQGLKGISSVRTDYMSGPSGDETQNVTWAGQQWSYSSNGRPVQVKNDSFNSTVTNSQVTVSVPATEIAVVSINSS